MPLALTFGSVGDIIGVASLIKDIIDTLSDSRGASGEYQRTIADLHDLYHLLLKLDSLATECEQRESFITEGLTARLKAQDCRVLAEDFLDKIQKYSKSLKKGGSGNKARDVYWKLHWRMTHGEYVEDFRKKVQMQIELISMLLWTDARKSELLADDRLQLLVQNVNTSVQQLRAESSAGSAVLAVLLQRIEQLERSTKEVVQQRTEQLDPSSATPFTLFVPQLKFTQACQMIWQISHATWQTVLHIYPQLPLILNPWRDPPAELDDALLRSLRIPLETIQSWEAFESVLIAKFKFDEGLERVRQKQYMLQDPRTKEIYQLNQSFQDCFKPGRRIVMSALFPDDRGGQTCPSCRKMNPGLGEEEVLCMCGMRYQRIVDLSYNRTQTNTTSRCTEVQELVDTPGCFKRVRLRPTFTQMWGSEESYVYWTCSECGYGPYTHSLYVSCINCAHELCSRCTFTEY